MSVKESDVEMVRAAKAARNTRNLALHSAEMEGGHVSDVFLHEAHDYANGLIDAATLGLRVCARYGLNDR
ncbi:hypothetical protein PG1513B_1291 [Bifidobacterium pseudolongum subsp. pseudolongum]|nr:hypothetical protein PG1513B_1291 [Bifidobacterium pseudolongum subsp. pseudolongum]